MKKRIGILVLIMACALFFVPNSAEAALNEQSYITVNTTSFGGDYLYDGSGNKTIVTVPGVSYDADANVLTLNGYIGGPISLDHMSGTKVEILGENTINYDSNAFAFALGGCYADFTIIGTGKITINDSAGERETDRFSWGAIHSIEDTIYIDGPTIHITGTKTNGIFSRGGIEIKNSEIEINNSEAGGIYSRGNTVCITDSDVNISANQYGLYAYGIDLYGNTNINLETTNNDPEAITLYSSANKFCFTTTGNIVLEKSDNGKFYETAPDTEHDTLDTIYKYDVTTETNKTTYTLNTITPKTLVELIEIDGTSVVPAAGETPKDLTISSEKYEVVYQYWFDDDDNDVIKFEKGKNYGIGLQLKPKGNYYFNDSTEWKLSCFEDNDTYFYSDASESKYGEIWVTAEFYVPEDQKEDHKDVSGGNQDDDAVNKNADPDESEVVETGDDSNMMLPIAAAAAALVLAGATIATRRKRS